MKLTVAMIVRKMLGAFPSGKAHIAINDAELGRPLLLAPGAPTERGRVYVCRPGIAAHARADALLVKIAEDGAETDTDGNVLTYPPGTDSDALMNELQQIFDRYARWDDSLLAVPGQQADLNELLNAATAMLQNPLLICAADYSIVARSSTLEDGTELSGSYVSYKLINALAFDKRFSDLEAQKQPYRYIERGSTTECLCLNLFAGGKLSGRILVAATERPLQPGDDVLLKRIAKYVRYMISGDHAFGRMAVFGQRARRAEVLLKSAISDEKIDYIPIINGLQEIGWLPEHGYCCVSIKIGTLDYRAHTVELLCNRLEELLAASRAFEHDGNVVAIVNLTRFLGDAEDVIGAIVYFLRDNFLKAGVSNEFTGFADMFYYYRQSMIALHFVTRPHGFRWIMRFSNIALDYMMEQCLREMPLHVVCDRSVLQMKNYDETHNTEFYRTLTCYVGNRFNAMATAKDLFIHRSTFLYRLERIRELFHVDLDNDNALLYTLISCKMLEMSNSLLPMAQTDEPGP